MEQTKQHFKNTINPSIVVIFGITGDLSTRYLLPALYDLFDQDLLPDKFHIIGFARTPLNKREIGALVTDALTKAPHVHTKKVGAFVKKISHVAGDISNPDDFATLGSAIDTVEQQYKVCANRLFYFATLPAFYEQIAHGMKSANLLKRCREDERTLRVLIEKPFGKDLASAQKLNTALRAYFHEDEIYRIDHYLGKETVQNLLTTRFANSIFEPIWNHTYIDRIEIDAVVETLGMEGKRGRFYDQTGALRDAVQNHLLQLLALVAMEPPKELSADAIHIEKHAVLSRLKKVLPSDMKRAQYTAGTVNGKKVRGYTHEEGVVKHSKTETYVALKVFINRARWKGVPFYLRTGKRQPERLSEIRIYFKPTTHALFENTTPNVLTFRIQPDESIHLQFISKKPGFSYELQPVTMRMGYEHMFDGKIPQAYEYLLLDWLLGNQSLFIRSDEMMASWQFITNILHAWEHDTTPLATYKAGTWGPYFDV